MRLGALEAFSQGLNYSPEASRTLLRRPLVRAPDTSGLYIRPRSKLDSWIRLPARPFPSFIRSYSRIDRRPKHLKEAPPPTKQVDDASDFVPSPKRREPEAWATVLDQCLPQLLRTGGGGEEDRPGDGFSNADPMSIERVPSILNAARRAAKIDLLSYIGIYQERWKAVHWLTTAMLDRCLPYSEMRQRLEGRPTALWDTNGRTLDEITGHHVEVKTPRRSQTGLEVSVGQHPLGMQGPTVTEAHQMLGSLWQSLGSMLLEVEDRSSGNPNRPLILSHVLQILAQIHHQDFLPDTIYNYNFVETTGSMLRRPPMLYLLSSKIFSDLSDASWKNQQASVVEKESDPGGDHHQKLTISRRLSQQQSQMPRIAPEVWLELVLWACVDGGWIPEAGWLVSEIQRRCDNPDRRWSASIDRHEISSKKLEGLSWISGIKREIARIRSNRASGIAEPANRQTIPTVNPDVETRTISRELILTIADGLVDLVTDNQLLLGISPSRVQTYLVSCKGLLEQGSPSMDSGHINTLILRAIEASAINGRLTQPGFVQMLMALRPAETEKPSTSLPLSPPASSLPPHSAFPPPTTPSSTVLSRTLLDTSAPILGLLHRLLNCFARQGNLKGSLQALRFLQDGVDSSRDIYIQEFADEMARRLRRQENFKSGAVPETRPSLQHTTSMVLYPEIPSHVVAAFLDLLVEFKAFEIGRWILFNNDVDGGILSRTSFSNTSIQPALLRFATATANEELLMKVLEHLEPPLSEPVLHALLRCQVALNRWDGVEGILKHLRDTSGMAWTSADAMAIAAAIPTLEWKDEFGNIGDLLRAKHLLQSLVQGEYNSPQNRGAQMSDLREMRRANQLGRIFQSATGALSTIELGPKGSFGRASYSVMIPSDAFNILLKSVIQSHGLRAGIQMWERWCLEPQEQIEFSDQTTRTTATSNVIPTDANGSEKVVQPTVSMLRLILQPATKDLKSIVDASMTKLASEEKAPEQLEPYPDGQSGEHAIMKGRERKFLSDPEGLLSIFDWCIKMFRKFGFSEREIRREIPPTFGNITKT